MDAFVAAVLVAVFSLLCATCGYAAYWLVGGTIALEVWQTLAVLWGVAVPFISVGGFLVWVGVV